MSEPSVICPDCKQSVPITGLTAHYAAHKTGTHSTATPTAPGPATPIHRELFSERLLNNSVWGPVLRRYWAHLILGAFVLGWLFGARII